MTAECSNTGPISAIPEWSRGLRRILLVKTSSMGDVIHAAPAISDAIAHRPDVTIDWAVEEAFADLARLHRHVRKVHSVAVRRWRRNLASYKVWAEIRALRRQLRVERYDAVIDAQGLLKSSVVAKLAGAPVHGFDWASAREPLASLSYQKGHPVDRRQHAVHRIRQLFAAVLGYPTPSTAPEFAFRRCAAPALSNAGKPIAVLLPGSSWTSKQWPVASWIALGELLVARQFQPFLLWHNDHASRQAEQIAQALPSLEILPRMDLVSIAGLLATSRLVIGMDSGLTHLAAAFNTPTVALFTSTSPELTGPLGAAAEHLRATTACAPCFKKLCPLVPAGDEPPCQTTITPRQCLAVIEEMLDRASRHAG